MKKTCDATEAENLGAKQATRRGPGQDRTMAAKGGYLLGTNTLSRTANLIPISGGGRAVTAPDIGPTRNFAMATRRPSFPSLGPHAAVGLAATQSETAHSALL